MPKIHDLEVDKYLADCVTITPEAIQEEFIRVPADLAYWGELHAQAVKVHLTAKMEVERMAAKLAMEYRERMSVEGKKTTEATVEAAVLLDSAYHEARLAAIEAEATRASLRSRFDAVAAKRDMVQSLGAQIRVEMERDPIVREAVRGSRVNRGDF